MFAAAKRVVVVGDIHGDFVRFITCLRAAQVINELNEWIAQPPDTFVVQMGDQLDSKNRVPCAEEDEWETIPDLSVLTLMGELDNLAIPHGGRVLSLIGNHELMNLVGDFSYVSPRSMMSTGGTPSARLQNIQHSCMEAMMKRYIVLRIGQLLFCHAGILPEHLNIVGENINDMNEAFREKLRGNPITPRHAQILNEVVCPMNGLLWTRRYMELAAVPTPDGMATLDACVSIVLQTTGCATMFIGHNSLENTTILSHGRLVFTDASFSRAYGQSKFQYIDILKDILTVVEVRCPKNDIRPATYGSESDI